MSNLKSQTVSGAKWLAASISTSALVSVVELALLARVLTPGELGVMTLVLVCYAFVQMLVSFGISNSIIVRQSVTIDELSSLHWLNTSVAVVLGAALALAAPAIEDFFNEPGLTIPLRVLALGLVLASQGEVARGVLEKELRFARITAPEIVSSLLELVLVVVLAYHGGVVGAAWGLAIAASLQSALWLLLGWRDARPHLHFRIAETRRFLSFGVFQSLDAVANYLGNSAGQLAIGRFLSASQLAGYNLAYTFTIKVPGQLNAVATRVMFPVLSRIQNDRHKYALNAVKLLSVTGIVNAPLLLGVALLANDFVDVVLGPRWSWVAPLLQVLAFAGYLRALSNPMGAILLGLGRVRLSFALDVAKTGVSVLGAGVAAWLFGPVGVCVALAAINCLAVLVNGVVLHRVLDVDGVALLKAHLLPLVLCLPLGAGVLAAHVALDLVLPALASLVACSLVGASLYVGTLLTTRQPIVRELRGALLGSQ